ncbi:PREDICTED: Williams-Beuren syndrome chromosomal region 27 protein-like isoform X1 [Poecilia mexicana]|uniref:Methyltransferase domain-containing protein n=1 Tax=Poecilia mexicana TaxID=48701 RepID=A0A3B3X8R5_9TELE|nr:PREDICTED: Williams-Beuren syndrome chromosomal region 27 protein-like isoform X1 [Poecilia mexicana]XP_014832779.1 PREDICTED: Williams-Beuren syndrome chromosomal region 27 protein-like isoform X1 [Poecilia mexicana]XP_014832785.1 PREDICTED: Williams-Beuren syndrome chromosomal region 27 protein-like isoform X1 [Poecilia mexicana]
MSADSNTFESVKAAVLSAHKSTTSEEKISFYNRWAENYEQDVAVLDYCAPSLAADCISSHFSSAREAALVLDVACGTGLVAKHDRDTIIVSSMTDTETFVEQMKKLGFEHFVGVDGSEVMLGKARQSGLYQDLKQCMLGKEPLPVQGGRFDVVVIVGALSVGNVPISTTRDLCNATKPGGFICMTTRSNQENSEYKAALDSELRKMEEEELWTCLEVTEVKDWERAVSEKEDGYISGVVYLYKKL